MAVGAKDSATGLSIYGDDLWLIFTDNSVNLRAGEGAGCSFFADQPAWRNSIAKVCINF
jgi:hypothetical protein